jgi:hypothetical protein
LPQDRVFFLYNHFQNALQAQSDLTFPGIDRAFPVDRYTFGLEKTLGDNFSAEIRMPLAGQTEFVTDRFEVSGGSVGNLAVIVKALLYKSCTFAVGLGVGIDTPIGSNVDGTVVVPPTAPTDGMETIQRQLPGTGTFTVHDDSVHVLPYAGFVWAPTCRLFAQGFAQVDVAANGNRIDYSERMLGNPTTSGQLGILNEQTLLYLDLSTGYWLYRNQCASRLTGLAALVEFHYTTTLQDTDVVAVPILANQYDLTFSNCRNRVDVMDVTVGVHAEFAHHTIGRVGAAFPMQTGDNRSFDSEIQAQIEQRF